MGIEIETAWGPMLAAFLASLVEFVEALTIVLAVGMVRGWRSALIGTGLALALLLALVVILGPALTRIPLDLVQLVVGTLLLLFGMRWLRKAILRASGVIALHDEEAAFAAETAAMQREGRNLSAGLDKVALAASFKIVMLEGIEVVFIVIAIGAAGRMLAPASIGALAALALVILLGVVVHRPLARVPENTLKFVVGGAALGFRHFLGGGGNRRCLAGRRSSARCPYPGVPRRRNRAGAARPCAPGEGRMMGWMKSAGQELVALFVDDGSIALTIIAWLAGGALCLRLFDVPPETEAFLLAAGFVLILAENVARTAGDKGSER